MTAAIQALAASGRGPAEVCKALGIGRSTFYKHAYEPNETTAKTLRDSSAGIDIHHAKDAADLFAQLGIEETKGSASKGKRRPATGDKKELARS